MLLITAETFMTTKNSKISSANLSQSPLTLHGHRFSACFREKEIWGGSERRGWSQGD